MVSNVFDALAKDGVDSEVPFVTEKAEILPVIVCVQNFGAPVRTAVVDDDDVDRDVKLRRKSIEFSDDPSDGLCLVIDWKKNVVDFQAP